MDLIGRSRKVFQIRTPWSTLKTLTSTEETRTATDSELIITFDRCRCGKILHNPNEVFATCAGGESLCENCSQTRCGICNRMICPDHTNKSKITKAEVCSFHSFSEIMISKLWK